MRKVPPGIQIILSKIILSMSEGPSQMVTSDVSLAAGCAVIKALPPNRYIDVHLSGNTLRRRILPRYWTVVQHRAKICVITIGRVVFAAEPETGLALRDNVALLILLTEYYQVGTCGSPLSGSKALASEQKP